jgi:hypothetical protein
MPPTTTKGLGLRPTSSKAPLHDRYKIERVDPPGLIALWHVFEHMRDPWKLLDAMARRVASGGASDVGATSIQFLLYCRI